MGCDIHLHTEVKLNGKWEHYNCANVPRNYELFGHMAGVRRDDIKPIAEPKGLPDDLSVITAMDAKHWGVDGHTHSWFDAKEIVELEDTYSKIATAPYEPWWPEKMWGYLFGNSWGGFAKWPEDYPKEIEDVRFVFWFDN